jgi:hypothetical protein
VAKHRAGSPIARRNIIRLWIACWVALLIGLFFPINCGTTRLTLLGGLAGVWAGGLALAWRMKLLRACLIALPFALGGILVVPGGRVRAEELREEYVLRLQAYDGTRYSWGGENSLGIDCSGLVRRAMIEANLKLAFTSGNPGLAREALSLWWYDSSAEALRDEYRETTRFAFAADSVNEVDPALLAPGDLAVMESGVHVMAYLGGGRWIEADPDAGKVIIVSVPEPGNPWFDMPVRITRWRQLAGDERPSYRSPVWPRDDPGR